MHCQNQMDCKILSTVVLNTTFNTINNSIHSRIKADQRLETQKGVLISCCMPSCRESTWARIAQSVER